MIQVTFHKQFLKKYFKLSERIRTRVDEQLELFQKDPRNSSLNMHRLHGEREGYHSINMGGDLRIILRVLQSGVVQLKDVGTHSELYG